MDKNSPQSSPVKILNYLMKDALKFVGKNKPFPSLSQLVNTSVREYLPKLKVKKK